MHSCQPLQRVEISGFLTLKYLHQILQQRFAWSAMKADVLFSVLKIYWYLGNWADTRTRAYGIRGYALRFVPSYYKRSGRSWSDWKVCEWPACGERTWSRWRHKNQKRLHTVSHTHAHTHSHIRTDLYCNYIHTLISPNNQFCSPSWIFEASTSTKFCAEAWLADVLASNV